MKPTHRLIRRAGIYYSFETATNKRESLQTRDKTEATQLLAAKMQSILQPVLNLRMAKVYLSGADPQALKRNWRDVLNAMIESKRGENRERWARMDRHRPLASLWNKIVIQTTSEDLVRCLNAGSVTTNKFLRIMRNYALDFGWLWEGMSGPGARMHIIPWDNHHKCKRVWRKNRGRGNARKLWM